MYMRLKIQWVYSEQTTQRKIVIPSYGFRHVASRALYITTKE